MCMFFNWTIVDLQHCISGVQQSNSVIHTYVCIYKTLMLGKIEGKRRTGQQRMRLVR